MESMYCIGLDVHKRKISFKNASAAVECGNGSDNVQRLDL